MDAVKSQQRVKAEVPRRIHEIGLGNLRQLYAKGRVSDQKGALCAYLCTTIQRQLCTSDKTAEEVEIVKHIKSWQRFDTRLFIDKMRQKIRAKDL